MKPGALTIALSLSALSAAAPAWAGPISGPAAKAQLQGYVTQYGGHFLNFQDRSVGPLSTEYEASHGVSFFSTIQVDGSPIVPPHNVLVSASFAYATAGLTIVGTPCASWCSDDGQVGFEVRFTSPQRWAGLHRYWYNGARTRFYSPQGTLLHEFDIPNGFLGFIADSEDVNQWVAKIVLDGVEVGGYRQVGYADDLMFGTGAPADPTPQIDLHMFAGITLSGAPGRTYRLEWVDLLADTNDWHALTNIVLPVSPYLLIDYGSTNSGSRYYRATLLP